MSVRAPKYLVFGLLMAAASLVCAAPDEVAARSLAKENNCFRCHAVDRDKDGPAWSAIATKYKNTADGEARLMKHLTSAPRIKLLEEGTEQEHKIAKFRDKAELRNLVDWVLSL